MYTIKVNNKTVSVSSETILEYLKYRKLNKEQYYYGMEETLAMYVQNIMNWANNTRKLNTHFQEIQPKLEKIALDLI